MLRELTSICSVVYNARPSQRCLHGCSELDLTDGDIDGGRERDATLGVNWYMNRWLKLMGNVVKVLDVDGGPFDGVEPTIYQMRFQVAI